MTGPTNPGTVIAFSKYESVGVDFALIADPGGELSFLSEHVAGLSSRGFGIGCVAVLRVTLGDPAADLAVDDGRAQFGNVWTTPAWDAALRCSAIFARDQGLATSDTVRIAMRSSGHDAGTATVEVIDGSLVRMEMGAPSFGLGEGPRGPGRGDSPIELGIPPGFDPGDDWWSIEGRRHLTLPVIPVMLRTRLHAVVHQNDVERIFHYVGPTSCLSTGVAVESARRVVAASGVFSRFEDRAVLDILQIHSPNRITVGGASMWRSATWPQGEGTCAAAAVAQLADGAQDTTYANLGFGDYVIECPRGPIDDNGPIMATAAAAKVFEGQLSDLGITRHVINRDRLHNLMS